MKRLTICLGLGLCCSACAVQSPLPTGQVAYQIIPTVAAPLDSQQYLIAPLDTVSVTVFREPDLSVQSGLVDPAGRLPVPLLGSVSAAGKTADVLATELQRDLATYLKNPRVTVSVNSFSQQVAVEGHVNEAGVYDVRGDSSLLEVIAMAQSPTEFADLDQIFVYRPADGQMLGARFNLRRIRAGLDPDPVIVAGDRVVVGLDAAAHAWKTYFADPIDNVFRVLTNCAVSEDEC